GHHVVRDGHSLLPHRSTPPSGPPATSRRLTSLATARPGHRIWPPPAPARPVPQYLTDAGEVGLAAHRARPGLGRRAVAGRVGRGGHHPRPGRGGEPKVSVTLSAVSGAAGVRRRPDSRSRPVNVWPWPGAGPSGGWGC